MALLHYLYVQKQRDIYIIARRRYDFYKGKYCSKARKFQDYVIFGIIKHLIFNILHFFAFQLTVEQVIWCRILKKQISYEVLHFKNI